MTSSSAEELMTEIAGLGYILHHLSRARKEASDRGHAELADGIRQQESDVRLERNLALERLQQAD